MLCSALGYRRLQYRFVAHSEERKMAKVEETALAKARLQYYLHNGDLDCSHWRWSTVTELARHGCQSALNSRVIDGRPDYFRNFSHEHAVQAWNTFLGFVPKNGGTESSS